jgi:hypothetical protein
MRKLGFVAIVGALISTLGAAAARAAFVSPDPSPGARARPDVTASQIPGSAEAFVVVSEAPSPTAPFILARRLGPDGAPVDSAPFEVSAPLPTGTTVRRPAVAQHPFSGMYLAVWEQDPHPFAGTTAVVGQGFMLSGASGVTYFPGGASPAPFLISNTCNRARNPDVAETFAGSTADFIVPWRCITTGSSVRVSLVNPFGPSAIPGAFSGPQGFVPDDDTFAPHIAFGDPTLANYLVLAYRLIDTSGSSRYFAHLVDPFGGVTTTPFFSTDPAFSIAGAPEVAFSPGSATGTPDMLAWTIVHRGEVGPGTLALLGRIFELGATPSDPPVPVPTLPPFGYLIDAAAGDFDIPSYSVSGAPGSSDFVVVYQKSVGFLLPNDVIGRRVVTDTVPPTVTLVFSSSSLDPLSPPAPDRAPDVSFLRNDASLQARYLSVWESSPAALAKTPFRLLGFSDDLP